MSEEKSPLVKQILHICELFLRDSGPTRDAASVCLSSLLTRPDMEAEYLSDYISWTTKMLKEWSNKSEAEKLELSKDSFLIIGVLHSLAHIFKKGHRHKLLPFSIPLMSPILKLAESPATTLVSKLLTKLFQRIGMTFLPPRIANWRYMRGHRLLLQNSLNAAPKKDEESEVEEDNNEVEAQYASEMEEVIEVMIVALQDNDTIVRWSGAKGIGRITMRLSKDLADDVVQAVIDLFADPEADGQWHGGCLALAELSRRGLLLPERLEEVIPIIERAMHFDILRGQHSIGAHVRDAACYVCWAFARAYSPTIMKPYIDQLSAAMLVTAVYDREINCRRAASAAFQETVGRQGSEVIPLGIDIITIADYFSLGIRHNAFLTIAPMVANLDSKIHIRYMSHLKDVKICHWDSDIREVAAKALAAIALIDVPLTVSILKEIISDCLSTNIFIRHGSLLATSELLSVLTIEGVPLSDDLLIDVANIVPQLDKARLYRGRGSDITRQASCILVQSIARANISVPMKLKIALTEIMNENLKQPHEAVQIAAADALRQLLFVCFGKGDAPSDRLSALTVDKYLEGIRSATNVAITRGYAIALGALPVRLATLPVGKFSEILSVLKSASSNTFCVNGEQDADTRRNAVTAIVEITEKSCDAVCFLQEDLQSALQCLFDASNDYAVDKRGDTGSWSRMAALRGMYRIAKKVVGIPAYNFQPIIEPAKVVADFQEGVTNSTYAIMTSYGNTVIKSVVTCGESKLVVTYSIREQDTFAVDVEADQYLVYNLNDHKFLVETRSSCSFCSLSISDESRFQIFQTIFKQLAEKLDAVRDIAGKVLLQFLLAQSCTSSRGRNQDDSVNNFKSYLPIPDYNIVVDSIESVMRDVLISNNTADSIGIEKISEKGNFNYQLIHWAQPEHVFPIVISLLRSKIYFDHIMAGLVVSIGGLTETIAKTSASVLLRYCKVDEATNIEHDRFLERLSACLIQLFVTYSRDDRVTLPLIKTLHVLIRSNVFIFFNHEQLDSFGQKLLSSLSVEMTKCSNLVKLCSAMDLCVLLFNFGRVSRSNTMKTMIKYLLHKYPRVRKRK